jgi:hypothetical protein
VDVKPRFALVSMRPASGTFLERDAVSKPVGGMRSMEIQMEVIRDKEGIYAGLLQSQSMAHQLAVCYNSDGKLIVKICTVVDIAGDKDNAMIRLRSQADIPANEVIVPVTHIESIYPIRDFVK